MRSLSSDTPPNSQSSLIGNDTQDIAALHTLESMQINRLISARYGGDPIGLIKQLLRDLQDREREILRLREPSREVTKENVRESDESDEDVLDNELESIKNWDIVDDYDDTPESFSFDVSQELPLELQSIRRKKSKLLIPIPKTDNVEIDKYGFVKRVRRSSIRVSSSNERPPPLLLRSNNSSSESLGILINEKNESRLINQLKQISQIHDDTNLYFDKKWDILIKDISYYFMFNTILEDTPSLGIRGVNLRHYYFPFVNLINQFGIPVRYRYLWLDLSGANNIRINGEYQELMTSSKTTKVIERSIEQIDLDLHRTLPSNYYFNNIFEFKPGVYFYKLQRILYAFVRKYPNIGYVQGMNKVIGTLLLGLPEEEDVFWLFISLIEEVLPQYDTSCFFNSISEVHEENVKLKQLLQVLVPEVHAHFARLDVEIEIITMNWWLTLFIDLKLMDLDTWFKIFDNLLIGDQALFLPAFTLAILKCLEGSLLRLGSNDEIYRFLNMENEGGQYNLKFHELMKHYLNYSRRKEVADVFLRE
ncbi:TBC domain-containing protein C4G8.04 [Candida viswanathii]|uniref:Oxidant-induced cell-cycle arrest protein 5 n=1 Tax=Candida viswanathii TaxID=5486 RepID=A0A367XQ71_9ASCO|nr:TBC domain-containing protein C4G8.04 [Candida viswanathii]